MTLPAPQHCLNSFSELVWSLQNGHTLIHYYMAAGNVHFSLPEHQDNRSEKKKSK